MNEKKLDKRRNYYLVLDCETATLSFTADYAAADKKKVAIAKPLIYDIGWTVVDISGCVMRRRSFIVAEIFSDYSVFQTAYYREKRPGYIAALENGETTVAPWDDIAAVLIRDMADCVAVGAYNANFDFKKAIPFTERYIRALYSNDFENWLDVQKAVCDRIISGEKSKWRGNKSDTENFHFRGWKIPVFDIWNMACTHLLNCKWYKEKCAVNGWRTDSGVYYKTSAETAYAFVTGNNEFVESHTALADALIESEIFGYAAAKNRKKVDLGIVAFPFRVLGRVEE